MKDKNLFKIQVSTWNNDDNDKLYTYISMRISFITSLINYFDSIIHRYVLGLIKWMDAALTKSSIKYLLLQYTAMN